MMAKQERKKLRTRKKEKVNNAIMM